MKTVNVKLTLQVPDRANWIAIDEDGAIYAYENEAVNGRVPGAGYWSTNCGRQTCIRSGEPGERYEGWRESLQRIGGDE